MTFKTHCEIARGHIDPAPMVDIVFLLLIFLALSSPLVVQTGIAVVLPSAKMTTVTSFQPCVLTVRRDNLLFFNNQLVTMGALKTVLAKAAQESRNQTLVIKEDEQVSHGTTVQILSIATEAGFTAVNVATRPEVSGRSSP